MITPVVEILVSIRRRAKASAAGKRPRPDPRMSGWICSTNLSIKLRCISDLISSPLPMIKRSLPGCSLRPATASPASPSRRIELLQGSGSARVMDATCFTASLRTAVKGLSVCLGQKEKKSSYVRRPNSRSGCWAIPSAATSPITASIRENAQPPCWNPPRTSSSGRPGACITPSSVTLLDTTTLPIACSLRVEWWSQSLPTRTASGQIDRLCACCGDGAEATADPICRCFLITGSAVELLEGLDHFAPEEKPLALADHLRT